MVASVARSWPAVVAAVVLTVAWVGRLMVMMVAVRMGGHSWLGWNDWLGGRSRRCRVVSLSNDTAADNNSHRIGLSLWDAHGAHLN